MSVKFVLHTGSVMSEYDRQVHTIPASRLISLYGLNPKDCIIDPRESQIRGYDEDELLHLYPVDNGEYRVKLHSELNQLRKNWLENNDPLNGADVVTPYDYLLYRFNSVNHDNT